jgi:hypothetical protein
MEAESGTTFSCDISKRQYLARLAEEVRPAYTPSTSWSDSAGEVSMMSLRSRPSPTCVRCLQPIADGDHVVFDNAEPFHLSCFTSTDPLVALAAAFIRVRPDAPICHVCLARALRISFEDARRITNTLRLNEDDYDLVVGERCRICRRDVAAIEFSGSAAKQPPARADGARAA